MDGSTGHHMLYRAMAYKKALLHQARLGVLVTKALCVPENSESNILVMKATNHSIRYDVSVSLNRAY